LALSCTVGAGAYAEAPEVLDVGERTPVSLILLTPTGTPGRTPSSDLIRTFDDALRRHTGLAMRAADDGLSQGCRGRLLCVVLRLRSDYERDSLRDGDSLRPYDAHLRTLSERGVVYAKLLLMVTNITREGEPDRLRAQLIDTDRALSLYHHASRTEADWESEVEAAINDEAPSSPAVSVADATEAARFVEELLTNHLRGALEHAGQWTPYGQIDLTATAPGLTIVLDDAPAGVTTRAAVQLSGVMPGTRRLRLEGAELEPFEATVEVRRGQIARVEPVLRVRPTPDATGTRLLVGLVGAAVATAGGVVLGLAAATPDTSLVTYCVADAVAGCAPSNAFVTSGYDASLRPLPNGGGVPLVPLGLGLVVGGATWGLGAWLLTDEDETPWIPLLVGAAAGSAALIISSMAAPTAFEGP
jgi:hypothetical protein